MAREKNLEKRLRNTVKRYGGLALKLWPFTFTGLPDRVVLMPKAKIYFAETKTTGDKLSERQKYVHNLLWKLGFHVWVLDSNPVLNNFIKTLEQDQL